MDTPQFQTAEYSATKAAESCKLCQQPLGETYFRVNGNVACERCATKAKLEAPTDSHSAFMKAVLYGIGGAIVGLIIYATFTIVTGIEIGYVSLAVGFIVGKAMNLGSSGFGGRRYQVTAALLTYAAVSMAAVPIAISVSAKQDSARHASAVSGGSSSTTDDSAANSAGTAPSPAPSVNIGSALLSLALLGLASPFLDLAQDPFHGLIGVVILAMGIRIAWKMTAGSELAQVVGPFRNPTPAATAPPSLG